jgi:CHAT domain-containing protein
MLESVERHGEPILLLYPVEGKVGRFLLRPGQPAEFTSSNGSVEDVLRAADRLRAALGVWKSGRARSGEDWKPPPDVVDDHRAAAKTLFDTLLAPFPEALSGEKRFTLVPYRELASVPFAVLSDDAGTPLCEKFALTMASSISMLRVLEGRSTAEASRRAFVVGDPDTQDERVPRLAMAAEEARELAARLRRATPAWDVRDPDDRNATVASYRELASDADLVHLACHGAVGNVARDSALLFAPGTSESGLLKPADIEAVRLRSALVFLSACRSGTGRPTADGTIGLSRAFLTAGADAVIGSLWNVPDLATRILVETFYDGYLSDTRADPATSLQHAMLEARDSLASQYGYTSPNEVHPAEWGAFFVLGRGTLISSA